ncbi:MAG: Na+/H+ antiporter subunit E [Armatimonadota bacterium]|nr:Na+/H+ antiporter subunit E [Armatimonadota bacterium]MDR7487953.1 Na+/H+ antiporter subunit E [Armatimonadota bacterium]MDR7491876.1 Na+/H+ antiporter subunit E [Armatimonadota bacterium]MDR7528385.1 Na+/H+ antiporter subunit E [Armatimonadota bacterium]MDR7574125.1 Na+/H+ antiporter subunit E [Armatimonadota bacterium]
MTLLRRLAAFCWLLPVVVYEIVVANLQVAAIVLHPRRRNRPGFITVPLDARGAAAVTALANLITMTPGTLTVDVAPDRTSLLVHVFDLPDAAGAVRTIKRRLEAPVRAVLE